MLSNEKQKVVSLIETDSWDEISKIAHKIKTSLIYINVNALIPVINELEHYQSHSNEKLKSNALILCNSIDEILLNLNNEYLPS